MGQLAGVSSCDERDTHVEEAYVLAVGSLYGDAVGLVVEQGLDERRSVAWTDKWRRRRHALHAASTLSSPSMVITAESISSGHSQYGQRRALRAHHVQPAKAAR